MNDLSKASKSSATLQALLDHDMEANCVRNAGSHSRNLLRVKRGLDMVRILFEQILVSEYVFSFFSNFSFSFLVLLVTSLVIDLAQAVHCSQFEFVANLIFNQHN